MKTLTLHLKNCYGIKQLDAELDFSNAKAKAIYAPNGSMKTSLARAFEDIAKGAESRDIIFPERACTRDVKDENNNDLPGESVLVVKPYEKPKISTQTSTLLVNAKLREEYETLHADRDKAKDVFLKALREQSQSKQTLDLEKEISRAFTSGDDQFFVALTRIRGEVSDRQDAPLKDVSYEIIFDDAVLEFLQKGDAKQAINDYITKYNELLAASTYFKKGVFNYYNAAQVAKQLAGNGFFEAKHSVNLNAADVENIKVISTKKELEELIANEKDAITNDKELRKKYADIEKHLQKNAKMRGFQEYIENHEEILAELSNVNAFREKVLKAYIDTHFGLYEDLLDKHEKATKRRKAIQEQAKKERTQWEEVINIFNSRFMVPFEMRASNREAVILGQQDILKLAFIFRDGNDESPVEHDELLKTLSTGESKAMHVLNVLFEIETRKKSRQNTLIVVDDIADSFDYKNKYAIIEYLMDISDNPLFRQIILTHNFDFYRTVESRFVGYKNCLMASKTGDGVSLNDATGIKNVFINDWKKHFYLDAKKKIASISFIRNLIEYTRGESDPGFRKLTSLLHWRVDTPDISVSELDSIYKVVFGGDGATPDGDMPVVAMIEAEAEKCLCAPEGINLENKVVLAIATRLAAEQFMVGQIDDEKFVEETKANQTARLLKKYEKMFPANEDEIKILKKVTLMTPENIHLNSFMYEPLLDMSDHHLRNLYEDVKSLRAKNGANQK